MAPEQRLVGRWRLDFLALVRCRLDS